jgi:cysteine desulfuration protein SufE
MTIDTFEDIKTTLSVFNGWEDKYQYLIDLGKKLTPIPQEYKTTKTKIVGCGTDTWIHLNMIDNKIDMQAESASQIVKGILYILECIYTGKTTKEAFNINAIEMLRSIDLLSNISATRYNGLQHMVVYIKKVCS